jgi:GDP-L-fucose synthase
MKYKTIIVTGGSSQIGKSLQGIMSGENIFYLSSKDFDLTNQLSVKSMYDKFKPDFVCHLSAVVSGIENNIKFPYNHYTENTLMNTMVLDEAYKRNVSGFITTLSTCAYADKLPEDFYPLKEENLCFGEPAETNYGYGISKRNLAIQINAGNKQYDSNYSFVIPANIYGQYDKFDYKTSHYVTALLMKIKHAVDNKLNSITLMGTGAPIRQFVYSLDVANLIKLSIENNITEPFNIASDEVYSIDEIAKIALKSCNAEHLSVLYDKTKPDGQYKKTCSNEKLKSLFPDFKFTSLEEGIKETWKCLNELK